MGIGPIESRLRRLFDQEGCRIVFWDDPGGDSTELVPHISFKDVKFIDLSRTSALEVKTLVDLRNPQDKFLLYSGGLPQAAQGWLNDILLYSPCFRADREDMVVRDLGLSNPILREHIRERLKFFAKKERRTRLKAIVRSDDTADDLDRKMLAIASGSDQAEAFSIILTLLHTVANGGSFNFEATPKAWPDIERFGLASTFWDLVHQQFEYEAEEPRFADLVFRMLVSDFGYHLNGELPVELCDLQLPVTGAQNAVVFLARWKDSYSKAGSFNWWADQAWSSLHIADLFRGYNADNVLAITTFAGVDGLIIADLLHRVESGSTAAAILRIIDKRRTGHWVFSSSVSEETQGLHLAEYNAISTAARLLELRRTHRAGFRADEAMSLFRMYVAELFQFDQLYRHFCVYAKAATEFGHDRLGRLRAKIEQCYVNWFLPNIALAWNRHVETCLPERWECRRVPHQYRFYSDNIQPWLEAGPSRRAWVIVSDALRYEVAEELARVLNRENSFRATLASQLGVLPSCTSLGMASLLPHRQLSYTAKGDVLLDGNPTASLTQRSDILRRVDGFAITAEELLSFGREASRKRVANSRVVYVYHNDIDATGDSANTESQAFEATAHAIKCLKGLVKYLVNSLNANYVVVTADHGFVFTTSTPELPDRSSIDSKPPGTVLAKKRYLLGRDLPEFKRAWRGETSATAKAAGDMQFWIPKGYNRFHFSGGARFIHGGAMLQEVVVPVIKVRRTARKKTRGSGIRQVDVQVLGSRHRITTPRHRFDLLQTEPVDESVKELTLKIAIYENDQPITDIQSVEFSSTSRHLSKRKKSVVLTLRNQAYDKHARYRLVLRNVLSGIRHEIPVTIERAFYDDF